MTPSAITNSKRMIGSTKLEVSRFCFGGNVFGWTADEATSFRLLDMFVDAGFNFIDTADVYSAWAPGHSGGESETVIGKWFAKSRKRDKVVLATKVGMVPTSHAACLKRDYILRQVEASLRRLQTDVIDLYWAHRDDAETPLTEVLETFAELIKSGKVRAIGASNYKADRLRHALNVSSENKLPRYQAIQPHYNLIEREEYEKTLQPVAVKEKLAVTPYFALAKGFLTGKYRSEADLSKSPRGAGVKPYLNDRGFRILAALDEVAAKLGSTPARVAIAWLLAQPSVTSVLASATNVEQLTHLIEGTKITLDAPMLEKLNSASAP